MELKGKQFLIKPTCVEYGGKIFEARNFIDKVEGGLNTPNYFFSLLAARALKDQKLREYYEEDNTAIIMGRVLDRHTLEPIKYGVLLHKNEIQWL